jgi:hypothetical protein
MFIILVCPDERLWLSRITVYMDECAINPYAPEAYLQQGIDNGEPRG